MLSSRPGAIPVTEVPARFILPPEGLALETLERQIILAALQHAGGNVSKASRLLRIQRGKLRYRIERLGLGNELDAITETRRRQNPKPMDATPECPTLTNMMCARRSAACGTSPPDLRRRVRAKISRNDFPRWRFCSAPLTLFMCCRASMVHLVP